MWSGADLVRLYRARGPLELVFKRLKQCLHLHQFALKDWQRASHLLRLNLLVWWLQEQEAQWMQDVLSSVLVACTAEIREARELAPPTDGQTEEEEEWVYSQWTLAHFCCEEVRTMLRGAWSRQRKVDCQEALLRYVRARKRPRGHRFTEQRAWLQERSTRLAACLTP